jgi:short-subunit dehydrogenase
MNKKIALVTGASSGIGKSTAIELFKNGFVVYAAARHLDKMVLLTEMGIRTISLDVTKEDSMTSCVNEILKNEGRIDVLVNNAGYGSYGAIEDVPIAEAHSQLEVNLFGLARMTQLVLQSMRKNKFGKIVNISSMGGKMVTPFGGWYHATKYAIEGLSDCLRMEVAPFGIDVIIIEPGITKTNWGTIAAKNLKKTSVNGAYSKMANQIAKTIIQRYSGDKLSSPELIAQTILKSVTVNKPKTRYLVGCGAKFYVFLKYILCDRAFDIIIKKKLT